MKQKSLLNVILIMLILMIIGISIGFFIVYLNMTNTSIDALLKVNTSMIQKWFLNVMKFLKSGAITNSLPAIQGLITTVSGVLGIVLLIKQLKKK